MKDPNPKADKHALYRKLMNLDLFGHTINLNFNGNGDSHKTVIGAFASLFIKTVMVVYTFYNFKKMFLY